MFEDKRLLAVIPARGGSKGIPRKNIREIAGKPLLAYSIDAALQSRYLDRVILSSDDEEIINVAKQFNCDVPFVRPPDLADDRTSNFATTLHAISMLPGFDYVVLLQPTSPLRTNEDIDGCIELCLRRPSNCCVSVTESPKSPFWMYFIDSSGRMEPVMSECATGERQMLPTAYVLNGAVYVAKIEWLKSTSTFVTNETIAFLMPRERSVDIDLEIDITFMEACLRRTTENG